MKRFLMLAAAAAFVCLAAGSGEAGVLSSAAHTSATAHAAGIVSQAGWRYHRRHRRCWWSHHRRHCRYWH